MYLQLHNHRLLLPGIYNGHSGFSTQQSVNPHAFSHTTPGGYSPLCVLDISMYVFFSVLKLETFFIFCVERQSPDRVCWRPDLDKSSPVV